MNVRTMTLQTQTPGGEAQPIPVAEAVAAVQAAIEVCNAEGEALFRDHGWAACARAGYAATLEFLLREVEEHQTERIYPRQRAYRAVAPIVAWHRAQGGRR